MAEYSKKSQMNMRNGSCDEYDEWQVSRRMNLRDQSLQKTMNDRIDEEEFKRKYGTLYDGLQLDDSADKRKSALIYPFLFILRRLIFMVTVVWFDYFVWIQIAT